MKVRIVKSSNNSWYANQIGSIVNVKVTDGSRGEFYFMDAPELSPSYIRMEDCVILEADEPKPEPFDLERALKGDKLITRSGRSVSQFHMFDAPKTTWSIHVVIDEEVNCFRSNGKFMSEISEHIDHPYDLFMAPREPEYQTVWVNLYDELNYNNNSFICSHAYINKSEAERNLANAGKPIGTFPITFKKP